MKYIFRRLAFLLLIISSTLVFSKTSKIECPKLKTIQFEGLNSADEIADKTFMTFHVSQYNSNKSWVFFLLPIKGMDKEEALNKSNDILSHMNSRPVPKTDNGKLFCQYPTHQPTIKAMIIDADDIFSISELRRFL